MRDDRCYQCSCGRPWGTQTEADWCRDECDAADESARRATRRQ